MPLKLDDIEVEVVQSGTHGIELVLCLDDQFMVALRVRPFFLLFSQRAIAALTAPLRPRASNPAIKNPSVLKLDHIGQLADEIGKLEIGLFRSQLMTDLVSNRDQDAVIVARLSHRQQDQMLTVLQPVGDLLGRFLSPEFRETLLDILDFQRPLLELVLPDDVFHLQRL